MREILSAMILACVVTWPAQMPTGLLTISAHYNLLKARPTKGDLLALRIQDSAVVLSAHSFNKGYGSVVEGLTMTST